MSDPMPETRETEPISVCCPQCPESIMFTVGRARGFLRCALCGHVATLTGRDALVMALGRMLLEETDDDFIPDHDCGFVNRPDTGYCRFHDKWFEARCALSAFDAAQEGDKDGK